MDPVTHGITGALIAEAGFRQKLGNHSRLALTAAAMLPDLDIVYRVGGLPEYIANHRGLSHSFVGLLASGFLLGGILGRFDEERRYVPWISAMLVALFSHQLLDLVTSYGTVVLYPFSHTRFYFDWVFIIDAILTGTLLAFLVAARRNPPRAVSRARKGLAAGCIYILFCALNHSLAIHQLKQAAQTENISYKSIAAIPQPIFPLRWSGIIDAETNYYQVPFLSISRPKLPYHVFTKSTGTFFEQVARSSEMGVLYLWFARYPVIEEKTQQEYHIVEFSDLRFYIRVSGLPVRKPFVLHFKIDKEGNILESRFARL